MKKRASTYVALTAAAGVLSGVSGAFAQTTVPANDSVILIASQQDISQLGREARSLADTYIDIARNVLGTAHNAATLPINQFCQKSHWTSKDTFACIDAILRMGNIYGLHNYAGAENLGKLQNLIDRSNRIQREEVTPQKPSGKAFQQRDI